MGSHRLLQDPSSNPYGLGNGVKYYMLEVEDWTQPGTSKRRQTSKKALVLSETREDPPVPLSAPPENEVEESFHPTRAPNSRHFPTAARSGTNPTAPAAGPSSLSRLLAQAPVTSEPAALPDPAPFRPALAPSPPLRTPSPPLPPSSSSPAHSSLATAVPGRPHPPHPSSPLRPGSRASSRYSAPRLPAFGGAGGSANKAVPTTAITAPSTTLDEPGGAGTLGPILTTTTAPAPAAPLPPDTAGEGMASLLARRRTTSFHVTPSGSSLVAPTPRQTGAGPAAALASLANWGSSFSRRRRTDAASASASESSVPPSQAGAPKQQDSAAGKTDAQRILQQF